MAFLLASLARTKQVLRIDHDDDDEMLGLLISAASRSVVRYLKGEAGDFLGIDSPPNSPPDDLDGVAEDVTMSVIILTGILYREPDGDEAKAFGHGTLPWMVTAMLYPLRLPTLA